MTREIDDSCSSDGMTGWMPVRHRSDHVPYSANESGIPHSLEEAINAFIISCCLRSYAGQQDKHCSMLIHVTRFNLSRPIYLTRSQLF